MKILKREKIKHRQLELFLDWPKKLRYTRNFNFADYGISEQRLKYLEQFCRDRRNLDIVKKAAHEANEILSPWLIESVTKGKSFDRIEYDIRLGQIPFGRTEFYGYRRRFYHLLDEKLKEEKIDKETKTEWTGSRAR